MGEKGTGTVQVPCAGASEGCKRVIKVIYSAQKMTVENPFGPGTVTGFDLTNAKETIQTNNVTCPFGEM